MYWEGREETKDLGIDETGGMSMAMISRARRWVGAGAVVLAMVLVAAVHAQAPQEPVPAGQADTKADVPRLPMADFKTMFAGGHVLVIDVRDPGSFKVGHIPGAVNVMFDDFEKRADQIKAKAAGRPIVLYCSCPSEHASAVAARMLLDRGAKDVSALVGGYPEWVAEGGRVER
jgi:rhodanese-related sulfurtransferase